MKAKEIRNMDKGSINEKILELKKELVKVNAQVAIGAAIKNPGQVRNLKKSLARILTINNQKVEKKSEENLEVRGNKKVPVSLSKNSEVRGKQRFSVPPRKNLEVKKKV
jgi:large subunit ribosomal protein L29